MTTKYVFEPDYAVAPGVTLKETLEVKGLTQTDLCARTGLAEKTISQIVNGVAPITLDTADKLELVLGVPATFWNNRELRYREFLAKEEAAERLQEDVKWLREIPVGELIDRGHISATDNRASLVRQVLKFFGVSSVKAWRGLWASPCFRYRGEATQRRHPGKVAAWLRMGEVLAEKVDCHPYDEKAFRAALREIRTYADKSASEWLPAMVSLCAAAGVAVVLVKEISGASVSGATKWLSKDKAMIMLSLKYKTDDHVWFTFFHEAAHVLLHGKKDVFIENDASTDNEQEKQADRFARETLIPSSRAAALPRLRGRIEIKAFARSIGVSPGIVVGRLQKDGFMPQTHLHDLKVKLQWPQSEINQ